MNDLIDIQHASHAMIPVTDDTLIEWVHSVLPPTHTDSELTLRLVDSMDMVQLNFAYRKQNKPTNVLAFPAELPPGIQLEHPFLGDVVICPEVLAQEHLALEIPLVAHWAHIVIHGVLHLLGHDHDLPEETQLMQTIEIQTLKKLGFSNPYATTEDKT